MYIEQLYTNCLAEAAYYIESEGEAMIIDPIRETAPYLKKLDERKAKLKYVFETHFHADFVSGHIDLARETGAKIVFGPKAETKYNVINAADEEIFNVGKLKIKVLHTPGHTPESACFLLYNDDGKAHAIFSGDTLFVGDVGRPDLLDGKMSKEELAGMMYESLNAKIKTLPDDVIVYPAHGPGSSCGKNIGKETWSTIGQQKASNYALQDMSKEKFIQTVTDGLSAPPQYFFKDAVINKNGYDRIDEVIKRNTQPLSIDQAKVFIQSNALVLDTRDADDFEKGFIPGSINVGLNGSFAIWAGTLLDIEAPLVLIVNEGKEAEVVTRLARVGFENIKGYLKGGVEAWNNSGNALDHIKSITAEEFAAKLNDSKYALLDVRKIGEFETAHVVNSQHICLSNLSKKTDVIDKSKTYMVYCAAGYRSMMASSILKAKGITNFVNVYGGFGKIKNTGVPLESAVMA